MIEVNDLIAMGLTLGSNMEFVDNQRACDWVLMCRHPLVNVYMNVNSIFGNHNTIAYKYYFVKDETCVDYQRANNLRKAPRFTIEVKQYNSDFSSYTRKAMAFFDFNHKLIEVGEENQKEIIRPNSIDAEEAKWAKPLCAEGETFIPYMKDTMEKFFNSHSFK